jgi:hypothetical protein
MRHYLRIVCILVFAIMACGCIYNSTDSSIGMISSDRYVAILVDHTNHSTLIGTTPYTPIQPPPIPTPTPMFDYDNSHGMLKGELSQYGVTVNDSFKVLIGKIYYIDTPTTVGCLGMDIKGVYALPYTVEDELTLVNVTSNGTIIATFENQTIYMEPGQDWAATIASANTTGAYLANTKNNNSFDYSNMSVMPWPVTSEISARFTNKGIFNKSNLSDA